MEIRYGRGNRWLICTSSFIQSDDTFFIPAGENRRHGLVGVDPIPGVLKQIQILIPDKGTYLLSPTGSATIKITENEIGMQVHDPIRTNLVKHFGSDILSELDSIRSRMKLLPADSEIEELPEQALALMNISPDANVLEIGGNVGRNTAIIGSILSKGHGSAIVLETIHAAAAKNREMCTSNGLKCDVVTAALSSERLVQKGWVTIPESALAECDDQIGWNTVPTLSLDDLKARGGIAFDTLVLDCEGAFCNILKSYPEILDGITTILIENDFRVEEDAVWTHQTLEDAGFEVHKSVPLTDVVESGVPAGLCMAERFFEVLKR
jgi:FkbM family methyltransferase